MAAVVHLITGSIGEAQPLACGADNVIAVFDLGEHWSSDIHDVTCQRCLASAVEPVEHRSTVVDGGIYVASKSKHGPMWQSLRESGWQISATWIDESGPGQTADMGALIEAGAALSSGARVFAVGCGEFNFTKHPRVTEMPTVLSALEAAHAATVATADSTRLALLERLLLEIVEADNDLSKSYTALDDCAAERRMESAISAARDLLAKGCSR